MSIPMPTTALIFAAGLGTRMRAFAPDIPKPLVEVAGKTLIDHTIELLLASGITHIVINVAYKAEMIMDHVAERWRNSDIVFSHEGEAPLETGGGIKHALPLLGSKPFFTVNSDTIVIDPERQALKRLAEAFDPETHDSVLLLCPLAQSRGYDGSGDFMALDAQLKRPTPEAPANTVYTGTQLLHPRLFTEGFFSTYQQTTFSLSDMFRQTVPQEGWLPRLGCVIHNNDWLHIGDGEGVRMAEGYLQNILNQRSYFSDR